MLFFSYLPGTTATISDSSPRVIQREYTYNRTYIFSHFVEGNIMPVYRTIPVYGVDIFAQSHFNVKDTNQLSPPFLSGRIRARPVAQPLVGVGPSKTRNTSPPPMFSTRSSVCKNALSRV